jgi:hypothetical protein
MDWDQMFDEYPPISRAVVESTRIDGGVHRIYFLGTHAKQPKRSTGDYVGKFEIPFLNTIGPIFTHDTGLELFSSKFGGFWHSIRTEASFQEVQNWVLKQGCRVFIRDCLDLSIALDLNFKDNTGIRTETGMLEARCKESRDVPAINALSDVMSNTISEICGYKDCSFIAAVPPRPGKGYDLPSSLASEIAKRRGLNDLTGHFTFSAPKGPIKAVKLNEKWTNWESAGLSFSFEFKQRPPVILIDDKYQSGITLQYVASRLRAAGAGKIYGLCVVKTLRDTDNS